MSLAPLQLSTRVRLTSDEDAWALFRKRMVALHRAPTGRLLTDLPPVERLPRAPGRAYPSRPRTRG